MKPFGGDDAQVSFENARVCVLPVPYEATVSYGRGTARGPEAILEASAQVELYDEQTRDEPYRAGIWTDRALPVDGAVPEQAVARISERFGELMDASKWVLMLGGEHTITTGGVRAAAERHEGLHLVQLDAHADLRESYEGDRFSHACVMARCADLAPIRAVGIRNYSVEEARRIDEGIPGYAVVHGWEMEGDTWIEKALDGLDGKCVYLTFDLDFFDPSVVPATGTPEPGGGTWWPTIRFLDALFRRTTVVACDVVELAPVRGLHHADFAAARLAYKLMGFAVRGAP